MEFKRLIVELGGLCMLVIRKVPNDPTKTGLYVLMPDNHHHKDQAHCPIFVAEKTHTASGNPEFVRLELKKKEDEVDLRFMAPHADPHATMPTIVANVSNFYKTTRGVDPGCFEGVNQHGLAARLILPLPASINQVGAEPADFFVPTKATGKFDRVPLYGQCQMEYKVHENIGSIWNGQLKGKELKPDGDTIKMYFVNARPKDLGGARYKHNEGDMWEHPQAYHDLLAGGSSLRGPRAVFGSDVSGAEDDNKKQDCGDISIPAWPPVRGGRVQILFIDPYTCTLGGGCPPNENC